MARGWTTTEERVLVHFAALGADGLAQILERSKSSVKSKAEALGISLEADQESIDLRLTPANLLRYVHRSPELQLCPMCGVRLAMMTSTGICRVCHLDRLIELRLEQIEVVAREKRLARLRQDKKRLEVCSVCSAAFYPRVPTSDLDEPLCTSCRGLA